jgi:hypothetical protein
LEDEDRRLISDAFAEAGLEGVEPESPELHRQAVAEWVVIAVPLLPFVQAISTKAGEDAYAVLKRLIQRLRDSRRHGDYIPRTVELFDSSTGMQVDLRGGDLPDAAWRPLAQIKLGSLEHAHEGLIWNDEGDRRHLQRLRLEWSDLTSHWLVYPGPLVTSGRPIGRRLPVIPAREALADPSFPGPLDLSHQPREPYLSPTWAFLDRYMGERASAISIVRARVVGWFNFGNQPEDIARQLVCSPELVNAVLDDFARHGLKALEPGFTDSRARSAFTLHQHEEMIEIARSARPGKRTAKWSLRSLGDFLVGQGVVEDLSLTDLKGLLAREGIQLSR